MWAFSWSFTLAFTWWNFKPLIFVRTAMWSIRASSPLLKLIRDLWQLISTWIGSSFCACDQIHSDGDQSDKWKDKFLDQERRKHSSSTHGSRLILPSIDLCPFAGVFVKPEGMAMLAQDSSSAFCGCASVRVSWRLFALKVPCTWCFLGRALYQKEQVDSWDLVHPAGEERRGGCTMPCSGQLASWFCAGKLRFLMDGQGKLGESDISHSTCHLSIQIFLAWFRTKLSATCVSSFAWLFCTHMLQQRFLVLNSATSNLLVTSFCPD